MRCLSAAVLKVGPNSHSHWIRLLLNSKIIYFSLSHYSTEKSADLTCFYAFGAIKGVPQYFLWEKKRLIFHNFFCCYFFHTSAASVSWLIKKKQYCCYGVVKLASQGTGKTCRTYFLSLSCTMTKSLENARSWRTHTTAVLQVLWFFSLHYHSSCFQTNTFDTIFRYL